MKFSELLAVAGSEPVLSASLLLAGAVRRADVARQLSRWTRSGRLLQMRRGLYVLAPPYRKVEPHPFVLSNAVVRGSYVSCASALAHHGLIPEEVAVVIGVSTGRPQRFETPFGVFLNRHVAPHMLFGYRSERLADGQQALVATAEKALLDLVHLAPGGDDPAFLEGLRLEHLDRIDSGTLRALAARAGSPKLRRAAAAIAELQAREAAEYEEV
jgi:predicted transcriptional regulator of viral defense system